MCVQIVIAEDVQLLPSSHPAWERSSSYTLVHPGNLLVITALAGLSGGNKCQRKLHIIQRRGEVNVNCFFVKKNNKNLQVAHLAQVVLNVLLVQLVQLALVDQVALAGPGSLPVLVHPEVH